MLGRVLIARICLVRVVSFLYILPCKSELGRYLLHGDDRYAVVSSRQRNTMTRAAWGTARFPSFSVSRLPRFQAGTVTRAAAPSLLLSLVLEVYLYFVVVSFFVLLWNYAFVSLVRSY